MPVSVTTYVRCFGGSLDGHTLRLNALEQHFEVAVSAGARGILTETYTIHRGTNEARNGYWYFATIAGLAPTDEMAQISDPN
jgi:hypothetical protein